MKTIIMEYTNEAKQKIIEEFITMNFKKEEILDQRFIPLFGLMDPISKNIAQYPYPFIMSAMVVLAKRYSMPQTEILNLVNSGVIVDLLFEMLKQEGIVDKIVDTAEVIHVQYDPETKTFKPVVLH